MHTSWPFDACILRNTLTCPADAYRYARGDTIKRLLGYPIRISTPLDWMGVPDHSEYVDTIRLWDPTSGTLDRIHIMKGWSRNGQTFEKISDVVWAGNPKPNRVSGQVPAIGTR